VGWQRRHAPRDQDAGGPEPSDEDLVVLARRDPTAFAALYRRYVTSIFRYCDRALSDRALAEEVTQTVFLRALSALPSAHGDAFRSWLFAIAHNAVVDARRARRPMTYLEEAIDLPDAAASPEELALEAVERNEITALLTRLPADQREPVELRLAGLSDKEIAYILGRSPGAIRTAQYRAVQQLRAWLAVETPQEVLHVAS
jgi:RNA polymerase sigma-70 factor, ECF subfamily